MRCSVANGRWFCITEGDMGQVLQIYPGTQSAVTGIAVEVVRHPAHLELKYTVTGDIAALALPAFGRSGRKDELWKHTCFEAFVRPAQDGPYFEFNLAPSTQWAAYGFTGYRKGMQNAEATPERFDAEQQAQAYTLKVALDLTGLPELSDDVPWRLNLSAVIEEKGGRKSYWALAHPKDKPDFHNPDCFVLELPPP